jgi:hypothetical protein
MNANAYYGNTENNNRQGYNNYYNQQQPPQNYSQNNNPYQNNPYNQANNLEQGLGFQYNSTTHTNEQCQYPQTGLNPNDAEPQNTRTEIVLPENVKLGMMLCSIFCFFLFFVMLIIK